MKKASKILLYVAGALLIVGIATSLLSLVLTWITTFLNVGLNITVTLMVATNANPDVVNSLLPFTSMTSIFKLILQALGVFSPETASRDAIMTYLITDSVFSLVQLLIRTVALIIPFILCIIGSILCFKANGKKGTKSTKIAVIVFGGLIYAASNPIFGILMLVGGVLGTISDSKEEKEDSKEEKPEAKEIKELPVVEDIE